MENMSLSNEHYTLLRPKMLFFIKELLIRTVYYSAKIFKKVLRYSHSSNLSSVIKFDFDSRCVEVNDKHNILILERRNYL